MRKILLSMLCGVSAAAFATSPTGIANVFGAESWQHITNPPYGMYNIPMDGSAPTLVSTTVVPANFGAVYADGRYFVIEGIATSASSFITNYIYDATTWQKITDFRGENITAFDMAWDEISGKVYGYFHNFDTNAEYFGTIDITNGHTTQISTLPFVVRAMSFDSNHQLYAISSTGALYTIDPATGASALKANLNCPGKWTTSGAIDSSTRTFYYVACNDDNSTIYKINLDTFAMENGGVIADNIEIAGLYFAEATAAPKAPAAPVVTLDFAGGALSGNVGIEIPSVNFDGSAATGSVTYRLLINGEEKSTANAAVGSTVSVPVAVPQAGEYKVSVVLDNVAGSSPVTRVTEWLGPDTPAAPAYVSISYDNNGTFTLEWPEATGAHGGWFDPATVTYTVTRYGDTTKKFDNLTDNTFTDRVSLPYEDEYATYHYDVAVKFGNVTGSSTSSEFYTIGSKTPPFAENFDARWDLGKFTILEGDISDNERWSYDSSKAVTLITYTQHGSDDYLLLPPLELNAGMVYPISFDIKGKYSSDTETFEVLAGLAPTVGNLTETILGPTDIKTTTYINQSMEFAPSADGVYFIAIHAISPPWKGAITIDNIRVGAGEVGIADVADGDNAIISARNGIIEIAAPVGSPIIISDIAGRSIANAVSQGSLSRAVAPGIYVVRAGNKVCRVIVR